MKRPFAVLAGLCLLVPAAFAAPPAKPAKPVARKEAAQKPAAPKPTAQKTAPKKQLPAGKAAKTSDEPPPGVRVQPAPGQAAAPAKPTTAKKAAAKPSPKKKHTAARKERIKSGRAAASASPMDGIDKNQLAIDHLKNAGAKSPVELLSSYKEVLRDGDLETAAVLLRLAANEEPSHQLVTRVNDLVGVTLDTQETQVLLEIARARRADAVVENVAESGGEGGEGGEGGASPVGARIHSAHKAVADAPRRSQLDALAIYKRAVAEKNPQAAALALRGVVQGPVDVAAVAAVNALLGLDGAAMSAEQIAGQTAIP